MKRLFNIVMLLAILAPGLAQAWWNGDWAQRRKITLNTSSTGLELKEAQTQVVVPLRLHTGNFSFLDAQEKGNDLRFIAADDKTPLKFHIEKFDSANNLAIVWVQLPNLTPAKADDSIYVYYGNPKAPAAEDAKGSYDVKQTAVLHFADGSAAPQDVTAYANHPVAQKIAAGEGVMGAGAKLDGSSSLVMPASPSLKLSASGGFTFAAWVKPAELQGDALLLSGKDGDKFIRIGLAGGKLYAKVKSGQGAAVELPAGGSIEAGKWHHVAVTIKDKLVAYVDGKEVGSAPVSMPDFAGQLTVGAADSLPGFKGDIDEVQLASIARSAAAITLSAASQGAESKLLNVGEDEAADSGGGSSYFTILLNSVTVDGWVVIGILMVMGVVSFGVMAGKALFVSKMARANNAFMEQFQNLSGEFMSLDQGDPDDEAKPGKGADEASAHLLKHSSLYRIYHTGVAELQRRFTRYDTDGKSRELSGAAIEAIRSSLDTGIVRETQRLNSQIVLLTIAISGGPFLGLLGTVVGVMITFAAIAAAGDVNVNAIAPGIAAALVATVAGLAVAIPSLFGYNYLSSRIKDLTADMHVFTDQLVTRMAESYGA